MQAIMETLFDVIYLAIILILGFKMLSQAKGNKQYVLFGWMALVLGFGDAFHLVPRMIALNTSGLADYVVALGIGKLITSITMTGFYVMLYHVWRLRYQIKDKRSLNILIYGLAILRIGLCLFPQNAWTQADAPVLWGIYRNIPFAFMGLLMILLFHKQSRDCNDRNFRFMALTIALSFLFYVPVVLWADAYPLIGMFMMPKTLAYVWTIWIGYQAMQNDFIDDSRTIQ